MEEVCQFACDNVAGDTDDAILLELGELACNIFSGFGHTKIIEDGLKTLRQAETMDNVNKRIAVWRRYSVLRDNGTMEAQR